MRPRSTKATAAGRAYLALRAAAKAEGRDFSELLQLYALEGFLDRLSTSRYSVRLVLKGGLLMGAYSLRRPTQDVDLQAQGLPGDEEAVLAMVREIAAIPRDDGLLMDAAGATSETIREDDEYTGIRVALPCGLSTARVGFHVDVNVGDPIWPAPRQIALSRLLGGSLTLTGYPLPMVHAEKIVTAVHRSIASTRWRDFADLYLLSGRHTIAGADLGRAIDEVARYRKVGLVPLAEAFLGYADRAQVRWAAWRRKHKLEDRLPTSFAEVLAAIMLFADPVLAGDVEGKTWNPAQRAWE